MQGDVTYSNETVASDAGKGAGGGAVAGAAWGLVCGPLAIVCAPVGALAGAIVGGTTGALVGSARGLNREQKAAISGQLQKYVAEHDVEREIVEALSRHLERTVTVVPAPASNTIALQVQAIELRGKGRGRLSLNMQVRVTATVRGDDGETRQRDHTFEYVGPDSPAKSWMDDRDGFLARRFEDAALTLSDNIRVALTTRG